MEPKTRDGSSHATDVLVDPVVERVGVEAVGTRLDLAGLVRYVVDAIDLPEIVRPSTG